MGGEEDHGDHDDYNGDKENEEDDAQGHGGGTDDADNDIYVWLLMVW